MSNPVPFGEALTLRVTFQAPDDNDVLGVADPTQVIFYLTPPSGIMSFYTLAAGQVSRVDTGVYDSPLIRPTQAGLWRYAWNATGAVTDSQEGLFEVEAAYDRPDSFRDADQLIADVRVDLGDLIIPAGIGDEQILRLLIDAQGVLEVQRAQSERLVWADEQENVVLPYDLLRIGEIVGAIPSYRIHGQMLHFDDPERVAAGNAMLHYYGRYPRLAEHQPCALPDPGCAAIVSYTCWRLCQRVAGDRMMYTRYATQLGSNAVEPDDILALGDLHRQAFEDAKRQLEFSSEDAPAYTG